MFFFFSSRRRHTRWPRDWSSDVCSSDLSFPGRARLKLPTRRKKSGNPMATASKARIKNSARRMGRSRIPKYATDIAAGAFIEISCAPKGKSIGIKVEANFRAHRIALLLARRQNENAPDDLNMVLEMISKIIRLQYFPRKLVALELVVRKDFDIFRPCHDTNRLTVVK